MLNNGLVKNKGLTQYRLFYILKKKSITLYKLYQKIVVDQNLL